jgi:hypothetical protein
VFPGHEIRLEALVIERSKTHTASRRQLLRAGACAAAATLLPAASVLGGARPLFRTPVNRENDSALLFRSTFRSQLNESFRVRQPSGRPWMRTVSLRLVDVKDVPTAAEAGTEGREDCFTAVFSGPSRAPLDQRTYPVTNASLGRIQLFLVPGGNSGSERLYTATFNRVVPA